MAVAPRLSASHDLFETKKNGRKSPMAPPNVSVEAIKRSLLHTPSPRRFKKLRLRRLKENKNEQVMHQLPLVDARPGILGQAYKGHRDDDGSCTVNSQSEERDKQDELDLAILNMGLDDGDVEVDCSIKRHQLLPCGIKFPFKTLQQDLLDPHRQLGYTKPSNSQAHEILAQPKWAWNSKKQKKQPRRLPADELVLTSERLAEMEPPEGGDDAGELSQDPISQLSSDDMCTRYHRPVSRCRATRSIRKGFQDMDISEFRLPKSRDLSLKGRHEPWQAADHADGFEGDEVFPVGKPMQMSQKYKRPSGFRPTNAPRQELQLAAYKNFGAQDDDIPVGTAQACLQFVESTALSDSEESNQRDISLVDGFLDGNCATGLFKQENELPDNFSIVSEIQTTRTISSRLARKQSKPRKVRFNAIVNESQELSPMAALPLKDIGDFVVRSKGTEHDKSELDHLAPFSWTSVHNLDEDISTFQELAMVSVQKRTYSSDSGDSSDAECCPYLYRQAKAGLQDSEKDYNVLVDLYSEDEGDIAMGHDVFSHLIQPESGQSSIELGDVQRLRCTPEVSETQLQ